MARKARIEYPGAFYHVINRGNYRSGIFESGTALEEAGGLADRLNMGTAKSVSSRLSSHRASRQGRGCPWNKLIKLECVADPCYGYFDQPLTLGEIAKWAGVSEGHFSKLFKKATGLTFVKYLTRMRVKQAQKDLRETRRSISEIAFASGFNSIAQFNRSFRKVTGQSPSKYRHEVMN